jgi:hypothetical protein
MLVAAKIRVCSVVYTDVADGLPLAIPPCLPSLAPEERLLGCKRCFFALLRARRASLPRSFRSKGAKPRAQSLRGKQLRQ